MKNIKLSEDLEQRMRYENSAFGKLGEKLVEKAKEGKALEQVVEDTHNGAYFDDIRATSGAYAKAFDSIEYKDDSKVKKIEKKYDFGRGKTKLKDLLKPTKSLGEEMEDELEQDDDLRQYISVKKEVSMLEDEEGLGDSNALIQAIELQDEDDDEVVLAKIRDKREKRKGEREAKLNEEKVVTQNYANLLEKYLK